ncbi:MAG: cyclic nucleotide-binding domain-containing protein [Planctomycetota bacterium]
MDKENSVMVVDQPNLLKVMSSTRFAEGLTNSQLQCLCRAARLVRVPRGTKLFCEGEMEDEIFIVSSGHVRLTMFVPGRGDVTFLTAGPGDLVGWSGLISDGRMTASGTVTEDSTLIALSGKRLQELCACEKELGYVLMKRVAQVLSQRLLATRIQMLDLFAQQYQGEPVL